MPEPDVVVVIAAPPRVKDTLNVPNEVFLFITQYVVKLSNGEGNAPDVVILIAVPLRGSTDDGVNTAGEPTDIVAACNNPRKAEPDTVVEPVTAWSP